MIGSSVDVTANSKCKGSYSFIKFKASALCFTNPLTTGRYVGIMTIKSQALQLCEVEIYSRGNSSLILNVIDPLTPRGFWPKCICGHFRDFQAGYGHAFLSTSIAFYDIFALTCADVKISRYW